MHVQANTTPASAPGGYVWETGDDIVEVPDDLGTQIIRIAGQFSEVLPTDPRHPHYVAPEPDEAEPEADNQGDAEADDLIGLQEPPRTGPLASKNAWRDYATSLGVDFSDSASRDEIIKLVDTRNDIAE